jgi:hypothetical protein
MEIRNFLQMPHTVKFVNVIYLTALSLHQTIRIMEGVSDGMSNE